MHFIVFIISIFILPFTLSQARADAVLECSTQSADQLQISTCLTEVETRITATLETALGFASDAATELDTITERKTAEPALSNAQAAWATYRDAHCAFVGTTFGGGSGTGIAIRGCRIDIGRQRIDALMAYTQ